MTATKRQRKREERRKEREKRERGKEREEERVAANRDTKKEQTKRERNKLNCVIILTAQIANDLHIAQLFVRLTSPSTLSLPPSPHHTTHLFQIDHRLSDSCLQEKQNKATKRCRATSSFTFPSPSLRPFLPPLPFPQAGNHSGQLPYAKRQTGLNSVTQ